MSSGLNVIALISGGKDSFFSLLHCVQNGHTIAALANLYPSDQPPLGSLPTNKVATASITGDEAPSNRSFDIQTESSDLNSFMYQTVGHSLIPLYSTVLQLPLYRQRIVGGSIQQSQYYDTSAFTDRSDTQSVLDETEDLIPLLRQVISAHPEANAISTGAILSTYQRTRIESIAIRLGLTPLSFLWQYPVLPPPLDVSKSSEHVNVHRPDSLTGLLEDIATSGIDARIIKIASAGITESSLFASIADARIHKRLVNSLSPFFEDNDEIGLRGAVLGEGGEYETIVLNGPRDVWKGGRIEIDEASNGSYTEGGVSYVRFGTAKVVPHVENDAAQFPDSTTPKHSRSLVPVPGLFDHQFENVRNHLHNMIDIRVGRTSKAQISNLTDNQHLERSNVPLSFTATSSTITISNLTSVSIARHIGTDADTSSLVSTIDSTTASGQLRIILSHLSTVLANLSQQFKLPFLNTRSISSTTILLSSILNFASINPIYSQIYPKGLPNPPARVTMAAPLSPEIQISLSLVLDLCPQDRRLGLHVQGRSYWAPANIGPYSQAIAVPLQSGDQSQGPCDNVNDEYMDICSLNKLEVVHIAGQIPLVPSSMDVYDAPFLDTAVLSLQHLWRVGQERGVDVWPWSVAYLSGTSDTTTAAQAHVAAAVWWEAHIESTWVHPDSDDESNSGNEASDDDGVDIWDIQRNRSQYHGFRQSNISVGKHLHLLPNHRIFHDKMQGRKSKQKYIPPFIAAEVTALPRNVGVEWWSNGIAGFTKLMSASGQESPRLYWHDKRFSWGSLSSLHITSPRSKVLFISLLVTANITTYTDGIPTTLSEIMNLLDNSDHNSPPNARIVQGTTLITTSALQSSVWADLKPQTSPLPVRDLGETLTTQPLSAQTTIIPCYQLWGHAATSVSAKSIGETSHDPPSELCLAFLLRVEVKN